MNIEYLNDKISDLNLELQKANERLHIQEDKIKQLEWEADEFEEQFEYFTQLIEVEIDSFDRDKSNVNELIASLRFVIENEGFGRI